MDDYRCWSHIAGVEPGSKATYDPACSVCIKLKAAGKRTGLEPAPKSGVHRRGLGQPIGATVMIRVLDSRHLRATGYIEGIGSGWYRADVVDTISGEPKGTRWMKKQLGHWIVLKEPPQSVAA
jgi:hypothetical protein